MRWNRASHGSPLVLERMRISEICTSTYFYQVSFFTSNDHCLKAPNLPILTHILAWLNSNVGQLRGGRNIFVCGTGPRQPERKQQ